MNESIRRRRSNTVNLKSRRFEKEWAKMDLAPTFIRGKADLQENALIVMSVKPEKAKTGKLLTSTALAV